MARITLDDVWVEFPVSVRGVARGALRTGGAIDSRRGVVTALRDIRLDIREGDRLGLMGHNGAGKSTLLRVLAGAYPPSRGRIVTTGSISTLFSTMPGLSMEGTARENILNCGLHLGLSRKQIAAKLDEIVDFAELGDFADLPVRIYSSGMMTRLGFAIATAVEPEILLLDEGLATGDAHFARKAEEKMQELMARSSILIVASHSSALLAKVCNRSILLEHGGIVAEGHAKELFENYRKSIVEGARRDDEGGLHRAFALAMDMMEKNEKVPLELEEQALRYALELAPDQTSHLRRYVTVVTEQGRKADPEIVARLYLATIDDGTATALARPKLRQIVDASPEALTVTTKARIAKALASEDSPKKPAVNA